MPEFNKQLTNDHVLLLSKIYEQLIHHGRIEHDFISNHIFRLDKVSKDIDTLMQRIASIRTWTYLSHKNNWLEDKINWQETSLTIEDKLSDALNNELTNRFVDKRISVLGKKLKENAKLLIEIKSDSSVFIDNLKVGEINGFILKVTDSSEPSSDLFLKNLKKGLIEEDTLRIRAKSKRQRDLTPIYKKKEHYKERHINLSEEQLQAKRQRDREYNERGGREKLR